MLISDWSSDVCSSDLICLYQSTETEWTPADGLFGFFDRVDKWFSAAGRGELDPLDAPLHPPVAYTTSDTNFVIAINAPKLVEGMPHWLGSADLQKVRKIGRANV